jgi:hypothetical protein
VCSISLADTKLRQAHMLPLTMIDAVLQSSIAVAMMLAGSADASSEAARRASGGGAAQVPYAMD